MAATAQSVRSLLVECLPHKWMVMTCASYQRAPIVSVCWMPTCVLYACRDAAGGARAAQVDWMFNLTDHTVTVGCGESVDFKWVYYYQSFDLLGVGIPYFNYGLLEVEPLGEHHLSAGCTPTAR